MSKKKRPPQPTTVTPFKAGRPRGAPANAPRQQAKPRQIVATAKPTTAEPNTLVVRLRTPDESRIVRLAQDATAGLAANAVTCVRYAKGWFGDVDLTAALEALTDTAARVHAGDLREAESLLVAQALSLNTIFTELARRAMLNVGQYPDAFERYLRLALKAQGQSRATLETLANVKNPPTVFAQQANVAHGSQLVSNGPIPARAGNLEIPPIELLRAHGEQLDAGTTSATGTGDQALAPVGTVHGPAKP
jgi:hypothetical protein